MPFLASSLQPMITPSILLKSWAIPPASVPMASIFWDCLSWFSNFAFKVTSRLMETYPKKRPMGLFIGETITSSIIKSLFFFLLLTLPVQTRSFSAVNSMSS